MSGDLPRGETGTTAEYPPYWPLEEWDRNYVLDLAAAARHDGWDLCSHTLHVERVCAELCDVAAELALEKDKHKASQVLVEELKRALAAAGLNNQIRGIFPDEISPLPEVVEIEVPTLGQEEICDDEG